MRGIGALQVSDTAFADGTSHGTLYHQESRELQSMNTTFRFPLAVALCVFALTGCDAVGPESVSATADKTGDPIVESAPFVAESMPGFNSAPSSMKSGEACILEVTAATPVTRWRGTDTFQIVSSTEFTAKVVASGDDGDEGTVYAITEAGDELSTVIRIDARATAC